MNKNTRPRSIWPSIAVATAASAFGGVIWFAYHVSPSGNDVPPLVKAELGPTKVKPDNPGEQMSPPKDSIVYERLLSGQNEHPTVESLLPPPETPVVRAPPVDAVDAAKPPPAKSGRPSSIDDLIKAAGADEPKTWSLGGN